MASIPGLPQWLTKPRSLPNELLCQIFSNVIVQESQPRLKTLHNIALASHTFYHLVTPFLYSSFSIPKTNRADFKDLRISMYLFLRTIVENPAHANHVKAVELALKPSSIPEDSWINANIPEEEILKKACQLFIPFNKTFWEALTNNTIYQYTCNNKTNAYAFLLLYLLPSIESLRIILTPTPAPTRFQRKSWPRFHRSRAPVPDPLFPDFVSLDQWCRPGGIMSSHNGIAILMNVRTFEVECTSFQYVNIAPWLQLPSLTEFRVSDMDINIESHVWTILDSSPSNVTTIDISQGSINLSTLRKLLEWCHKLKSFVYIFDKNYVRGSPNRASPCAIIDALRLYSSTSLQALEIHRGVDFHIPSPPDYWDRSLHALEKLEKLTIDPLIVLGTPDEVEALHPDPTGGFSHLSSLLPLSLKEMCLFDSGVKEHLAYNQDKIAALVQTTQVAFPALHVLVDVY